jgi:hypothetical protein
MEAARAAAGPNGVVAVADPAWASAKALAAPEEGAAAWLARGDFADVAAAISAADAEGAALAEHDAPARARVSRLLGGALVEALRRLR